MNSRSKWRMPVVLLSSALGLGGCAANRPVDTTVQSAVWEAELYREMQALKQTMEDAANRERSLAGRLSRLENVAAVQSEEMHEVRQQLTDCQTAVDSLRSSLGEKTAQPSTPAASSKAELRVVYRKALDRYQNRQYQEALEQFARILNTDPYGQWSDNAQYWKGECYYGLGKYHEALTEFTKVFAFEKTEKADDAQLKIARCYLALGQQDKALAAFEKLLNEYPESEYIPVARRQMEPLQKR